MTITLQNKNGFIIPAPGCSFLIEDDLTIIYGTGIGIDLINLGQYTSLYSTRIVINELKEAYYMHEHDSYNYDMPDKEYPFTTSLIWKENMQISDLELSVRSYNCLRHAGIQTFQDLEELYNNCTLHSIKNLGRKSVEEIITAIERELSLH